MKRISKSDKFLNAKRYAKLLKKNKNLRNLKRRQRKLNLLENKIYTSQFLSESSPYSVKSGFSLSNDIVIPEVFSIISSPEAALSTFSQLVFNARHKKNLKKVSIDHSHMKEVDLAAEFILDRAAVELLKEKKSRQIKLNMTGFYPLDKRLRRYIKAIGIIKNLDIKHEFLTLKEESNLEIFERQNNRLSRQEGMGVTDYKEQIVIDFVEHINKCLNKNGSELTLEAIDELMEYTGEILSNAEDHSGSEDWTIAGYYDHEEDNHICEIAIFNTGKSIAETFLELNPSSYAYKCIEPYILAHEKSSLFTESWKKEDLITLASLQGNISTKNISSNDTRGQGTVEMIEFFQQIYRECNTKASSCAKMAILSGSTHILFDGKYEIISNNTGRKVIAFNAENDLNKLPDKKYIKNIKNHFFPGTIISIRFPLQESQTSRV
ncbi:MAG: hypothetical protein OEW99_00440 [Gammaproteobacteria bacterium]|nr:hypothetical protein [Gammaproteobacteria bacterium]